MKKPTNLFKRAAIAVMAASIVAATPTVASAAWETTGKGWNWIVNGQKATGWQWIDSQWYFMDSTGTMKTGWVQEGGSWYYLAPSGAMATGWTMADGTWYYLKSSGAMATGWVNDNGSWYRMNTSGAMITGWTSWNGGWYYMAPGGDMVTGVIKVDGATYAMDATGKMQTGEVAIEGKTYTFGEDGAAVGEAPEATRTFSGAAETTNTGTGTGGTTTPSKPNRPSYGGGSVVTPPGDGDDDGDGDNTGSDVVTEPKTVTTKAELDALDKTKTYADLTIAIEDADAAIDLSTVKANKVTLTNTSSQSVTLGAECSKEVVLKDNIAVTSGKPLEKVTVDAEGKSVTVNTPVKELNVTKATDVTVSAVAETITTAAPVIVSATGSANSVTATSEATVTVEASGTVGEVSAAATVTINGSAEKVTAAADVTVTGSGSVGAVEAGANAVTISVPANKVTATTGKVTLDTGATVAELKTGGDVDIKGTAEVDTIVPTGTGQNIDMVDATKVGTILANKDNVNATVNGEAPGDSSLDDKFKESVDAPSEEKGDYTLEGADADSPKKGSITPSAEADALDMEILVDGNWEALNAKKELAPGKHNVRFNDAESSKMSESAEITISSFTGFGTADKTFYKNSQEDTSLNGWVVDPNATSDTYWVASGVKAGASEWHLDTGSEKKWIYADENSKQTTNVFDTTNIKGGEMKIEGLAVGMRYKAPGDADWTTIAAGDLTNGVLTVAKAGNYTVTHAEIDGVDDYEGITVPVTLVKAALAAGSIEAEEAVATDPTHVTLKFKDGYTPVEGTAFEYRSVADSNAAYTALTFSEGKATVAPGEYQIRIADSATNAASDPITVIAIGWTGFGTDTDADTYYENGAKITKAKWLEDGSFYIKDDSTKAKSMWVPKKDDPDWLLWIGEDGDGSKATDFGMWDLKYTEAKEGDKVISCTISGLSDKLQCFKNDDETALSFTGDTLTVELGEEESMTITVKVSKVTEAAAAAAENVPSLEYNCPFKAPTPPTTE